MNFSSVNSNKEKISGKQASMWLKSDPVLHIHNSALLIQCLNLIFNVFLLRVDFLSVTTEVLFILFLLLPL